MFINRSPLLDEILQPSRPEWFTKTEHQENTTVQLEVDSDRNLRIVFPWDTEEHEKIGLKVSSVRDLRSVKFKFTADSYMNGFYNNRSMTAVLENLGSHQITGLDEVKVFRPDTAHVVAIFPEQCYNT